MKAKSNNASYYNMGVECVRQSLKTKYRRKRKKEQIGASNDFQVETIHGPITLRVYQPLKRKSDGLSYVYYHGGGGVLLSIEEYDSLCRHLCNLSGAIVISVDYHLAPEYKFPVQLDDAIAAYLWTIDNSSALSINTDRIVVVGDSFGGYLATEVCLESQRLGYICPFAQILLYPRTDYCRRDLDSFRAYSKGYGLD